MNQIGWSVIPSDPQMTEPRSRTESRRRARPAWHGNQSKHPAGVCWLFALAADASGQLHVSGHDGDTLSMERAEIRVLKQTDEMRFTSFLQREDRKTLKSDVVPHVLSYFLHQPTKGSLPHQKIRRSLVTTNFPQRYSAWPKTSSRSLRNPSALPAIACCPGSVGLVAPSRYGRITLLDSNHDDQ